MIRLQQLEEIQEQLRDVLKGQRRIMATADDLKTTTARIQAAVQTATTNITQLITDTNAQIAALKSQSGPVMQSQLDDIVRQNNATIANLDALNSAITTEDAAVAPVPAAADPTPTPTPDPTPVAVATPDPVPTPTPVQTPAAVVDPTSISTPFESAPAPTAAPTEAAPTAAVTEEPTPTPTTEAAATTTTTT